MEYTKKKSTLHSVCWQKCAILASLSSFPCKLANKMEAKQALVAVSCLLMIHMTSASLARWELDPHPGKSVINYLYIFANIWSIYGPLMNFRLRGFLCHGCARRRRRIPTGPGRRQRVAAHSWLLAVHQAHLRRIRGQIHSHKSEVPV